LLPWDWSNAEESEYICSTPKIDILREDASNVETTSEDISDHVDR
jgi:hypothetical protein